jgi:hypothetical protein
MQPDSPKHGPMDKHADSAGTSLPAVVSPSTRPLPAVLAAAGPSAEFAWDEFCAQLRNPHTRTLYRRAVLRFLQWLEPTGIGLPHVTPGMIGASFDRRRAEPRGQRSAASATRPRKG